MSNPSTAVAGQLGAPYGTTPARVTYQPNNNRLTQGQRLTQPNLTTANSFSGWNVQNAATVNGALQPTNGLSLYQQSERGLTPLPLTSFRSSDRVPQAVTPVKLSQSLSTNQIPSSFSPTDISYWQSQGYDVNELAAAGLISYNASTNKYVITQAGMEANSAAQNAQQPLQTGQYVNSQGRVAQGATPFGTNAQGQRLDANGNVFDARNPSQATDIYGGAVIAEGATRWGRNANGRVVRLVASNGGWRELRNRRRDNQRGGRAVAGDAVAVSNAFLNVATG